MADIAGLRAVQRLRQLLVVVAFVSVVAVSCSEASAATGVWWGITSGSWPSALPSGGTGVVIVTAENLGYETASGATTPIAIADRLPDGVRVTMQSGRPMIEAVAGEQATLRHNRGPVECSLHAEQEVVCEFRGVIPPFDEIEVRIGVTVQPEANNTETNSVEVVGGANRTRSHKAIAVGEPPTFGIEAYEFRAEEVDGAETAHAGSHPFQLTSVLKFNTSSVATNWHKQQPAGLPKDLAFHLPRGLIGNPTPFDQCTDAEFTTQQPGTTHDECPAQTAVGVASVTLDARNGGDLDTRRVPVFNLVPSDGEPARFGFEVLGFGATIDTAVRTGGDYGVDIHVSNLPQIGGVLASKVTLWGVPGDRRHDVARGWSCIEEEATECSSDETEARPFLSMPTSCEGPITTSVQTDSWSDPRPSLSEAPPLYREARLGGLDGCDQVPFAPTISLIPETGHASTPTGVVVKLHIAQDSAADPSGLTPGALRDAVVTLPAGVELNPSGADGLEACSETEVGYLGRDTGEPDTELFTPNLPEPFCPDAAKVGTVRVRTPVLRNPLSGAVYLAEQNANPFGSLVAMYLVVEEPASGLRAKLTGEVQLTDTGQITTTFKNNPQVPVEDIELRFFGGARGPLGTPAYCGAYATQAKLRPWSRATAMDVAAAPFIIDAGPDGASCSNPLPFAPTAAVGSSNIQAGAFTALSTTITRHDGEQDIQAASVRTPAGISGVLSGLTLCDEAKADQGTCGTDSWIGHTVVSVGLGETPFTVTGGSVYLTGPHNGAPFGLSIVEPANAGPFHLGNIVVRARIDVDPHTAQLTVSTDTSGPHQIPEYLQGIPLRLQHVNVTVDRQQFAINPTSCRAQDFSVTVTSTQSTANLRGPFAVANCERLAFRPVFTVSTQAKSSKRRGASLKVSLKYPAGSLGRSANIKSVKVDLPKQLPARLTTLQRACPGRVFDENPAACPAASLVGHATATTPIIPVTLNGPAYFVSHGGEAFPNLVIVLQGYGVTVDLVGDTFISKSGVTSSKFETTPDVPLNSFELVLPEGAYSALAAPGERLCRTRLRMPTAITAQNGRAIHRNTKIKVTGCHRRHRSKPKRHRRQGKRVKT